MLPYVRMCMRQSGSVNGPSTVNVNLNALIERTGTLTFLHKFVAIKIENRMGIHAACHVHISMPRMWNLSLLHIWNLSLIPYTPHIFMEYCEAVSFRLYLSATSCLGQEFVSGGKPSQYMESYLNPLYSTYIHDKKETVKWLSFRLYLSATSCLGLELGSGIGPRPYKENLSLLRICNLSLILYTPYIFMTKRN